jgi:prlF antitoxin for toxin YhaV_toxin
MASTARSNSEQYNGKVTPVGNSKGIRLDAAFFKAHPEFNGEVRATVLADGQVLLSAKGAVRRPAENDDADPIMLGFLQFLEKQMADHPDLIEAVDRNQLTHIGKLVEGVGTDDSAH